MESIQTYLPGILLAYGAFLVGIASPGPNVMAVMGTSMSIGRPQGLALAMGIAVGSLTWALLTALGLSAILTQYAYTLFIIKLFGGAYLLYLAYKAFKSAASAHDIEATALHNPSTTAVSYAIRGYTIQMTNPKAALSWIAIMSLGLTTDAPVWVAAIIVLGTFVLSVILHGLYALAFSSAPMVRLYARARRGIQFILGTFFTIVGLRLLMSRS
ncbi:MAG: LysE family translocator [Pseudomonadota bacterium]